MKRRLSEIHPIVYKTRIQQKRLFRRLVDASRGFRFASERLERALPFTCKKHQSLLRRKLGNSDPQLQENKVRNLEIACPTIDRLLIRPGETFSFWRQVGEATAEKGYAEACSFHGGRSSGGGGALPVATYLLDGLHTPLE